MHGFNVGLGPRNPQRTAVGCGSGWGERLFCFAWHSRTTFGWPNNSNLPENSNPVAFGKHMDMWHWHRDRVEGHQQWCACETIEPIELDKRKWGKQNQFHMKEVLVSFQPGQPAHWGLIKSQYSVSNWMPRTRACRRSGPKKHSCYSWKLGGTKRRNNGY